VADRPLRILISSTPVGPLGSGIGGGVELTLYSLTRGLTALGHHVEVVAPAGSIDIGVPVHQVPGAPQRAAQNQGRDAPITMPADSVLAEMWAWVAAHQDDHDVVLNMAYDWLPFYLTGFLEVPVAHLVSMPSLSDAMDDVMIATSLLRQDALAVHSRAQAETFHPVADRLRIVGSGIALDRYEPRLEPDEPRHLGFLGRIAQEKGIGDVFAVAAQTGLPIKVWGLMQDPDLWEKASARHPGAPVLYQGFLPTDELQAAVGGCAALLMTPKWVEAFGNVAIEAMACGVPVISYRRGGPAEVVVDGETGFLVEPDSIAGLVAAVGRIDEIDRRRCRQEVEERWSTDAFAARVEAWLGDVAARSGPRALRR
jgi:UDP-glucose:tetrahydrobiopterin glucosyltransferase